MTQFEIEERLSLIHPNHNHKHAYSIHNPCLVKSIGTNLLVSKCIYCDISYIIDLIDTLCFVH